MGGSSDSEEFTVEETCEATHTAVAVTSGVPMEGIKRRSILTENNLYDFRRKCQIPNSMCFWLSFVEDMASYPANRTVVCMYDKTMKDGACFPLPQEA